MTIANGGELPARLEGKFSAMVVCWVLGLGSLVSWNSMLTIGDYYYNLFPDYHPSRVLTLVYQPFALGTMAILAYNESKIDTRRRNLIGYLLFFASTFLLVVLDLVTSGRGGIGPYIGICVLVGAFGVADAHVQGGMVGDLAFMLPEFIQSFLAGLAASGALTSGLRLITKAAFEKASDGLRKGAMLFLGISTFIELVCVVLYAYFFPKLPIVKYFRSKAASEGSKTVKADLAAAGIQTREDQGDEDNVKQNDRLSNKQLLLENIDYALDLYLIYVLTLSIFPGFLFENTGEHKLGSWYPLVLIAAYNVWDLISRYLPLVKFLKIESRKGLMIAILSRFLLIPAFYFTAKYGDQGWMILLVSFLGITNGHLTVCVLTAAPKGYKGPEQNALGNLLVLFLLAGIFSGVALDWLWLIGKKWNLHKEPIPVSWERPEIGWTKLNFDGSCKGRACKGSIGGVFRNHKAEFLLGYAEPIGRTNSVIAELAALRRGLDLVLENGYTNVWLESDAKTLVDIIVQKRQVKNAELGRHLHHINLIIPEINNCIVTHIYREGNRAADKLAQIGHQLQKPQIWWHIPPNEVLRIMHEDAEVEGFLVSLL
ncbi:Equilibrative nucleoside transporter [Corchorus olitorius]|uniref:Equilibrative nucleoside transporter n=1 Tax=Corchorus olitorius TaxID=93759 RepID=A0A1R3H3W5_9ROSI|nr:Equilibrative nucleoside transporter [Corchorus olitorius]